MFEDAFPGKIILTATFISGPTNDAAAARVITFADSVREASSEAHTVEMRPLSILAESSNDVASVVPSVDFLHKGTYQFDLSFTDLATNVAPDQSITVIFDIQTDPLSVTSPVAGAFLGDPFFVNFSLPELGSSSVGVTIEFIKISSATEFGFEEEYFAKHIVKLDIFALGGHSIAISQLSNLSASNALVSSVSVEPTRVSISSEDLDLNEGTTYNISLSYQDAFLNDLSTVSVGLLEFSGSATREPTLTSPSMGAALSTAFNLSFTIPEIPLPGSLKVILTTISGDDTTEKRTISFDSSTGIENRASHFLAITSLESAASALEAISSVSPNTALVDGAVYNVSVSYRDIVGNPEAVATSTVSFHARRNIGSNNFVAFKSLLFENGF